MCDAVTQQQQSDNRYNTWVCFYGLCEGSAIRGRRQYGTCSVDLARCDYFPDAARGVQQPEKL